MKTKLFLPLISAIAIFLAAEAPFNNLLPTNNRGMIEAATVNGTRKITQGALQALGRNGQLRAECPLKHTDVKAEISGSLARVTVTQEFQNPFKEKIEAVYVFPLPQSAAVDDMTMVIGDRAVKGKIKRREEARAIYEAAREAGQVASLLDQERPNIFTQSVANIMPGARSQDHHQLCRDFEVRGRRLRIRFPDGRRPALHSGPADRTSKGGGLAPDTSQVPDASRITPQCGSRRHARRTRHLNRGHTRRRRPDR